MSIAEVLELGGVDLAALHGGRQHRADERACGRAGDPLWLVAGVDERRDGADQADPLDTAAGQDQVGALVG